MAEFIPVQPFQLVIFGGTGDLSRRKLLPALYHRFLDDQIPADTRIIASARTEMDRDAFLEMAREACKSAKDGVQWSEEAFEAFSKMLDYQTLDISGPERDWRALGEKLSFDGRPVIYYLATSPSLYVTICEAMQGADLVHETCRIVLEKPIGKDLASAKAINDGVGAVFEEHQIYRIDHYLGKETVQNLMVLRFSNALFEPLWSRNHIDHIQITVSEDLGLEGRVGYYDGSGALRDMVQNHILQLLCLIAMEPPNSMEADDIRTEKIKVLRALKPLTNETVKRNTVRGQYVEGLVEGKPAKGYLDELGDPSSTTETFVAIKAEVENWRWAGVPVYLRTGKRMPRRNSEVVVQFKPVAHSIFGQGASEPNQLLLKLQPDEAVQLFLHIKEPGPGGLRIRSLPLNLAYSDNFVLSYPDAYERLLMEVARGNLALFMRRDEVEAAWTWVDGIIAAWNASETRPENYPAGSEGPLSSAMLMDRDGRSWRAPNGAN